MNELEQFIKDLEKLLEKYKKKQTPVFWGWQEASWEGPWES